MPVFSFPAPLFIIIPTLILAVLVNGWPSLPPPPSSPALPLVKLPLGYYRDVFINAVYVPLSALFLSLHLPPHFPHLSSPLSPLKMTSSSFSPSSHLSVCLAAFSFILSLPHVSFRPSPPPPPSLSSSLSKSHYFVNFVAGRCQRDLICKSRSVELIPNLPKQLERGSIQTASPIEVFTIPRGLRLCLELK